MHFRQLLMARRKWTVHRLELRAAHGRNKNLALNCDGRKNPLLRFDLSTIPANSAVVSATLWLYNTTAKLERTGGKPVQANDVPNW